MQYLFTSNSCWLSYKNLMFVLCFYCCHPLSRHHPLFMGNCSCVLADLRPIKNQFSFLRPHRPCENTLKSRLISSLSSMLFSIIQINSVIHQACIVCPIPQFLIHGLNTAQYLPSSSGTSWFHVCFYIFCLHTQSMSRIAITFPFQPLKKWWSLRMSVLFTCWLLFGLSLPLWCKPH